MEEITISKLRAACSAVLATVRKTGKPVLVTRRGEPLAQILPVLTTKKHRKWVGSFASTGKIVGDIVSPASDGDEWEALR